MDVNIIRTDFPIFSKNPNYIYFDNAATTFKPKCVIERVNKFYENSTSNIHRGEYLIARENNELFDNSRKSIATLINCKNEEIIFTFNTTHALNQVAYSFGENLLKSGDIILTTKVEHASSILPFFRLEKKYNIKIEYIDVEDDGNISIDKLKKSINERTKAIVIAQVTNTLGGTRPIKEICKVAHEHNMLVVVDGAQSVPHMPVDVVNLDCDFMVFSGHKMCGPDGVGVLFAKYKLLEKMDPLLMGGDMSYRFQSEGKLVLKNIPYRFEAGTPNIEGVIGLGAASDYLMKIGIDNINRYEQELRKYLLEKLLKLTNIKVINKKSDTGPILFSVYGVIALDAASFLSSRGIAVRSGDHCAKTLGEVIKKTSTVRISLYFYNTKDEIDKLVDAISDISVESSTGSYF